MKLIKNLKTPVSFFLVIFAFLLIGCDDEYPDLEDGLYAEFVTNKGTMVAELFYEETPVTVANFVALAEGTHPMVKEEFKNKKYYNGLIFHRVIDQFMIQGGDPTGTGSGDPGYKFPDEFNPDLKHDKPGMLSMANSGPATNGSQFFITEVPTPNLDNRHTVFGELVLGLDIQDTISNVKTANRDKPVDDVIITALNIVRKGSDAKKFDAAKVFESELPKVEQRQEELRQEKMKKMEEEKRKMDEKNAEAGADLKPTLDEYTSKSKTMASGLKMHYIAKGEGEKPSTGETAKFNYEGYFLDGRLFDSNVQAIDERHGKLNEMKVQRGGYQPMPVKISPDAQMIPGFREAIAQLRVGDKAFFYIPSHLAYGDKPYGPNGEIPANSDLIFIIEMTEVVE